jgi:Carboxypeptidase regulatory-like domain
MKIEGYRAVLALLCIFCLSASAQTHTSTVFGNVRDESGAALQAVEIQIVEENTHSTRNTMSGRNGSFVVSALPQGGTW